MTISRRTRSDGRETIALVKKHALVEFDKYGAINFNLDRVIDASGVSRSSIYHHFGNREGLIASVSLEQSLDRILKELELVERLADATTTPSAMFEILTLGLTTGNGSSARARRLRRIAGFAATESNKSIGRSMREVQLNGTGHFVRILEKAEARGLIAPKAPLRGIAYLLQSILIGRVVTDIIGSKDIDDDWLRASLVAIQSLLGTDQI